MPSDRTWESPIRSTPKTVFRAGGAISYGSTSDQAGLNSAAPGTSTSIPRSGLRSLRRASDRRESVCARAIALGIRCPLAGFQLRTIPFPAAPGVIPPSSPFVSIAPNAGRLPRIFQWSIGFQREIIARSGGGCLLRGQSRRLVDGAAAGRPELQRAYAGGS